MNSFIGCDNSYEESQIVLFGAPYDGAASFRSGAKYAPSEMRKLCDEAIETYSPYQDMDLEDIKIHDFGDIVFSSEDPGVAVGEIEKTVQRFVHDGKLPVMIGGDHLVTFGAIKVLAEKYSDLHIIHLDAHADLRDSYHDNKLSHASVMRRAYDLVGDGRIYQFGIRSGEKEEFEWAKGKVHMQKFDCKGLPEVIKAIANKPVYLSIDIDVLDPSEMPGTGTPEAGGISFKELLDSVLALRKSSIVGTDITELSPPCDPDGISTITTCKLLRELLLALVSSS